MHIGITSTYYARHDGRTSSVDGRFAAALEARGATVTHIDPLRCGYELDGRRIAITLDGAPLALDGLLVRRAAHHWNAVKTLVLFAAETGAACVDRPDTFLGTLSGKFQALLRRYRLAEGSSPRSFLYFRREVAAAAPPPPEAFPLLRKPVRGSLGAGIHRVDDPAAFTKYLTRYDFSDPLMLQQRVGGDEYRALMLGGRCLGVVVKRPAPGGLGNYALGAAFEPAPDDDAAAVARLGAAIMAEAPYDFAAVDLIRSPDGRLHVLECNRNPHFRGFEEAFPDVDVASEVVDFLLDRVRGRRRSA